MTSQAGPGPGQSGAASPWTRPPEQPAPYRLPARLSDMLHGWLDGKRGIPEVPNGRTSAVSMAAASDTETGYPKLSDSPDVAKPQIRPPTLWTPRIEVLVRRSRELIEEERIRFADDWSELKRRSIEYQMSLDPLKEQVTALDERLNQARVQPSNAELGNAASPSRTRGADLTPWSALGARPPGIDGSGQRRSNSSRQPPSWHGRPTRSGCTRISSASAPRWHGLPRVVITNSPCGVSPLTYSNWSVSTHVAPS